MRNIFLFEATRIDDVRFYKHYSPTVARYWGTGGARVPYIYESKSVFEENWAERDVKNTLRATASKSSYAVVTPIQDAREVDKKQNGIGIGEANAPAYTVDTVSHQSVAMASTVRRLTPTECERLQGFPDEWTSGQVDSHRYKQMGNAVAVPVVEWIIKRIN